MIIFLWWQVTMRYEGNDNAPTIWYLPVTPADDTDQSHPCQEP
jgi:hypothetical protein